MLRKTKGTPVSSHSSLLPNSPQPQQLLQFLSVDLFVLDISHKWNVHRAAFVTGFFSMGIVFSRFIHIVECFHCFLILWYKCPQHRYATYCLCFHQLMDVFGHMSNAINTYVQVYADIRFHFFGTHT